MFFWPSLLLCMCVLVCVCVFFSVGVLVLLDATAACCFFCLVLFPPDVDGIYLLLLLLLLPATLFCFPLDVDGIFIVAAAAACGADTAARSVTPWNCRRRKASRTAWPGWLSAGARWAKLTRLSAVFVSIQQYRRSNRAMKCSPLAGSV